MHLWLRLFLPASELSLWGVSDLICWRGDLDICPKIPSKTSIENTEAREAPCCTSFSSHFNLSDCNLLSEFFKREGNFSGSITGDCDLALFKQCDHYAIFLVTVHSFSGFLGFCLAPREVIKSKRFFCKKNKKNKRNHLPKNGGEWSWKDAKTLERLLQQRW